VEQAFQFRPVLGRTVGQGMFGLGPYEFIGVEFRGVPGETLHVESRMPAQEVLNQLSPVDRASVPEEEDRSTDVVQEGAHEGHHLHPGEVLVMKPEIERQVLPLGRHGEGRDGGDPIPLVAMAEQGCLAHGSPGLTDMGDEQEPALIEEREVSAQPLPFFLARASDTASSARWPRRSAPAPGVRVSGSSTPIARAGGPYNLDGTGSGSASR
jgi:hypothetical protein